jgi:hypothetical protein
LAASSTLQQTQRTVRHPPSVIRNRDGLRFTRVTEQAGIRFRHVHGGTGKKFFVESMGAGGGFFDYDGDGWLDIYLIQGAVLPGFKADGPLRNHLYRNNRDGTFTDVTDASGLGDTGYGMGFCVGDYDNDGDPDVYLANWGTSRLYRNNGNGTFTDVTQQARVGDQGFCSGAAFVDYDRDGHLDLYGAHYVQYALDKDVPCYYNDEGVQKKAYCHPRYYKAEADRLFHNNGDGTFSDVTQKAGIVDKEGKGLGVVAGDFDRDGWIDIYVANDTTPNYLWHNNGNGTFTNAALEKGIAYGEGGVTQAGMGVDVADYNNDGWLDVVTTYFSGETNGLYRNQQGRFFTEESNRAGVMQPSLPYVGFGTGFADFDLDGWKDLFVANGHVTDDVQYYFIKNTVTFAQPNLLFHNKDNGRFEEVSKQAGDGLKTVKVSRGAAFGDYDNDGDVDILVTNMNDTPDLLRNDTPLRNHWITLELLGTKGNHSAIGAEVKVVANGKSQVGYVKSGGSYLSQSDLRLTFGLRSSKIAETVEILWQGERREVYRNLASNQFYRVTEGQGISPQRATP